MNAMECFVYIVLAKRKSFPNKLLIVNKRFWKSETIYNPLASLPSSCRHWYFQTGGAIVALWR